MAEIDKLDALVQFKPFYNKQTVERMLHGYSLKPHLYKPESVTQLKEHAMHYKLEWPEPPANTPKDSSFNILRAVRGVGEGFLTGFSTFQVGKPSNNPYERIMRSVGELAGFVGYVPTAPAKILGSKALVDAARSLKGNSVPMFIARQATKRVSPVVSNTLNKAATAKNAAFSDAAKFLTTTPQVGHIAEGAFHLGVASSVSSWQHGIHAMMEGGLHGAVTGGVFRGIANLINRGGIPKIDKLTGKKVLDATQKEDQMLRSVAASLYEGLRSTARGETTPEQVYAYLLGAYFGANETSAGQARAYKVVAEIEKKAQKSAEALKRLDPETGKPYQDDALLFDPEMAYSGFRDLPTDIQASVRQHIAARHGRHDQLTEMANRVLEEAGLEPGLDAQIAITEKANLIAERQITSEAKKIEGRLESVKVLSPRLMGQNKDKVYLVDSNAPSKIKSKENAVVIPGDLVDGPQGENVATNRATIKEILKDIPKDKKIVVTAGKGIGTPLKVDAPQTYKFLQDQIFKMTDKRELAKQSLAKKNKILETEKEDDATVADVGMVHETVIQKKSAYFVNKYLPKIIPENATQEKIGVVKSKAEEKIADILEKHYNKYDGETINDQAFIKDVQKAFPDQPTFGDSAQGELRQLLIRRNMQRQVPHASLAFNNNSKDSHLNSTFIIMPESEPQTLTGNSKMQGDSIKAIERVYEALVLQATGKAATDRAYIVLDHLTSVADGKTYKDIEIKDIAAKSNFRGDNAKNQKSAKFAANRLIQDALQGAESKGYYYNGGKGTTGAMYFFKHHPETLNIKDINAEVRSIAPLFEKNGLKHYSAFRKAFMTKYSGQGSKGKGQLKISQDYFDKAFISNLLWEREVSGLNKTFPTLKEYVQFLTKRNKDGNLLNTQIPDAKGFNKRNQILLTDGFDLDAVKFQAVYKGVLNNGKANFRIFRDANNKNLTINDKANLYTESTDGSILVEENFIKALNTTFGLPESGQNKSFIVSPDINNGMFLGKFMFHQASSKASKWMRDNDMHFLVPETAAKEFGSRQVGDMKINEDGSASFTYAADKPAPVKIPKGKRLGLSEKAVGKWKLEDLINEKLVKRGDVPPGNPYELVNQGYKTAHSIPESSAKNMNLKVGDFVEFWNDAKPNEKVTVQITKAPRDISEIHPEAWSEKEGWHADMHELFGGYKQFEFKHYDPNQMKLDFTKDSGKYQLDLKDIKGSLSEKQTDHMLSAQMIPKQLLANLNPMAFKRISQKTINEFFDEVIGIKYEGEKSWNTRLQESLKSSEIGEAQSSELINNIHKMGLSEVVDALRNTDHPQFVAKMYQHILQTNQDALTLEYQGGYLQKADYIDSVAKAKSISSSISRIVNSYPDVSIFLHKDVRNYVETAVRNFIVNKVTRPKFKYSVSARMRGLDPWLANEPGLKDLNLGGKDRVDYKGKNMTYKQYIKEKYGAKNPDELFFLDNKFKDNKYDMSDFITEDKPVTLEYAYNKYYKDPETRAKHPKVAEFFRAIGMRVPMDSISGAHRLTFAGFSEIDGHGAIFHPRTMKALGGADLDGDKAFLFFGMKKKFKDMYYNNKAEYLDKATGQIKDSKDSKLSKVARDILTDTLNPRDKHGKYLLEKIAKKEAISYQDLLTLTNRGKESDLELKKSLIGRFDPFSRFRISEDAAAGRDQLGPAVISKQVLMATHNALVNNPVQRYIEKKSGKVIDTQFYESLNAKNKDRYKPDTREAIRFTPYKAKKEYVIYIEPRVSPKELEYARELSRAQIAFGSDPLDELGLTGTNAFFDNAWHAHFKIDWNGNPQLKDKFSPNFNARTGTYKIFKDFNDAYFSKNWEAGRRFYAHEILDRAGSIHSLTKEQRNTMLPKMVELLEPLDYTDNMLRRVEIDPLLNRYEEFAKNEMKDLSAYNYGDKDFPRKEGGILGRFSFRSDYSPVIGRVIENELFDVKKRAFAIEDHNAFTNLFKDMDHKWYGTQRFFAKAFPSEHSHLYPDLNKLSKAQAFAKKFRESQVDRIYRQANDFMQNDAMDRTSAQQLLKAIDSAKNTGTSNDFIAKMSKYVEKIKLKDRAERAKAALGLLKENEYYMRLDENGKWRVEQLFEIDAGLKAYERGLEIDDMVRKFKVDNEIKKEQGGEGPLSEAESYLFDTMMLSTYYRGKDMTKSSHYENLPKDVQDIVRPLIREIRSSGSGTYFEKTGLNSKYVNNAAIQDFFKTFAGEFKSVRKGKVKDFDTEGALESEAGKSESKEKAPPDIFENELSGILEIRERAKKSSYELDNVERQMVDELAGHLNYYHNSVGTPESLNKISRGLLRKNFDALGLEDYRVLNRYFNDMRTGNIFIKDGKLTADNIVKLSKRHHILFPRAVSEELMIKDFKLFEAEGRFQNYKGEWRRGMVGKPTQVVESIQYVLGESQASATKLQEDLTNEFHEELLKLTGYESIPKGRGSDFFEVASAERDMRAFKENYKAMSKTEYKNKITMYEENLAEAHARANWEKNENRKFAVRLHGEKGTTAARTGREIVDSINDVLTSQSKKAMRLIYGKHYMWSEKDQAYIRNENVKDPLDDFYVRKGNKIQYWDGNKRSPKVNVEKFSKHIMNQLKSGKPISMEMGLDNLRRISRSIQLEKLEGERAFETDREIIEGYDQLIGSLRNHHVDKTGSFHPENYHPHFIENKSIAKKGLIKAIEDVKKQTGKGEDWQKSEIKRYINQYRSMTGDWMTGEVIQDQMVQGALKEIAEKRKGAHMEWFNGNPIASNMMSRKSHLPGFARDVGAWDMYHKNLVDTYFRQIGQIASKHLLNDFNKTTAKTWKDPEQARAWNNYISDYISRSLGYPSKIPDHWLKGPEAKLMNIKGTPYAWYADNVVKDRLNKIKRALGFKEDLRLPEELRGIDEMTLRHWSNLEAKYEMATLLAHPKSAVGNIFGGQLHTIQSVGWRTWRNARNINYLKTHLGGKATEFKSRDDVNRWVIEHGVIPDFMRHELGLNPNFKSGKWRNFGEDAKKLFDRDPNVKDVTLIELAKKHKITEAAFDKAAWFMREPERMLRRDSFVAHYLQAKELYGHANMELNHPLLINMAKKGVQATQFLYSAPYRPAFSATALGKVMTRFHTWAWNSVRFRNDAFKQAKLYGFREGTPAFDRFKRQYLSDMFVFALGNVFAYSLFETAMPAPYNWFQDTADWIFGDEKERDRAFFGQWPTGIAPLQIVTPPGIRFLPMNPQIFKSIANNDFSRLSEYYTWTLFPFGRMARDAKGIIENPMRTIEKTTGIPYQAFAREATKYREGVIQPLGKRETKKLAKNYEWMNRALTNPIRTTDNESVRTAVEQHPEHGWMVFPTIRMKDGKLKKYRLKKAMQIAIEKNDFIPVDSVDEGNRISKGFSERLSLNETENKQL